MSLNEARKLKQDLVAAGTGRLGLTVRALRAGSCVGIVSGGLTAGGPPHPSPLALGIEPTDLRPRPGRRPATRGGDEGDYLLAVRVLRSIPGVDRTLERLQEAARGEVAVRVVGWVVPQAAQSAAQHPAGRCRSRPLLGGCSVGGPGGAAGTLGAVVEPLGRGGRLLLTCSHVASPPGAVVGDGVLQPAPADGGCLPDDLVGRLVRTVGPDFRRRNRVDGALAELVSGVAAEARRLPGVGRLAGRRREPLLGGETVFKVGRTSGVTRGRVSAVELDDVAVTFPGRGSAVFDGLFEVEVEGGASFSRPGDSGALVVDAERRVVGMVFAGNGVDLSYVLPIGPVLDRLRVRLA